MSRTSSVELRGLEPLTPCMPCRCATSCATAPNLLGKLSCEGPSSLKQPVYLKPHFRFTRIGTPSRGKSSGRAVTFRVEATLGRSEGRCWQQFPGRAQRWPGHAGGCRQCTGAVASARAVRGAFGHRSGPGRARASARVRESCTHTRIGSNLCVPTLAAHLSIHRKLAHKKIRRNLSIPADYPVELRGLEPLTPCMPCRCATSCATAPNFRCSDSVSLRFRLRLFVRISPKQLKYLRTAFRKIPNRAYSALPPGCYSDSDAAAAFAEASSPSCRSTTGQSFQRRSRA